MVKKSTILPPKIRPSSLLKGEPGGIKLTWVVAATSSLNNSVIESEFEFMKSSSNISILVKNRMGSSCFELAKLVTYDLT